ncbi:MAG: hypothetical protein MZU95_02635 [Desulfomicrobium escambiense]|nr:hypothetical protein [Desulfomicrobium escambiense]
MVNSKDLLSQNLSCRPIDLRLGAAAGAVHPGEHVGPRRARAVQGEALACRHRDRRARRVPGAGHHQRHPGGHRRRHPDAGRWPRRPTSSGARTAPGWWTGRCWRTSSRNCCDGERSCPSRMSTSTRPWAGW